MTASDEASTDAMNVVQSICMSSYGARLAGASWWVIAPLAGFARYPGPALLVGGGRDMFVPVAEMEEFRAAARQPAELWVEPRLGHDGVSNTLAPEYRARVLAFLARAIGVPA